MVRMTSAAASSAKGAHSWRLRTARAKVEQRRRDRSKGQGMGHKANRDRKKNKHISQHNHLVYELSSRAKRGICSSPQRCRSRAPLGMTTFGSQLRLLRERMLPVKGRAKFLSGIHPCESTLQRLFRMQLLRIVWSIAVTEPSYSRSAIPKCSSTTCRSRVEEHRCAKDGAAHRAQDSHSGDRGSGRHRRRGRCSTAPFSSSSVSVMGYWAQLRYTRPR